jgi:hypothetical protein
MMDHRYLHPSGQRAVGTLPTLYTFPNRGPILFALFAFASPTLKLFPNNAMERPRCFLRYNQPSSAPYRAC